MININNAVFSQYENGVFTCMKEMFEIDIIIHVPIDRMDEQDKMYPLDENSFFNVLLEETLEIDELLY